MDPFLLYFFWRSNLQNLHSSPSSPGWQSSRWKPWNPEVGPMKSAPAALTPMASMMTPLQTPNASKPTSREGTWGVPSEGTGNSSRELRSSQSWKQHQITRTYKDNTRTYLYTLHSDTFGTFWNLLDWGLASACLRASSRLGRGRSVDPLLGRKLHGCPRPRCTEVFGCRYIMMCSGVKGIKARYSKIFHWVRDCFKNCWSTVQFVLDYISRQVFGQHWTTIEVIIMRSIGTL